MNYKYSVILGNLGNTRDRFCSGYKDNPPTLKMLERAFTIPHVTGIELVGTWDISRGSAKEMGQALQQQGWECVSIIPDLFTRPEFGRCALATPDDKNRSLALDECRAMAEIAMQLNCPMLNIWPGQDGFDYLLATDYALERDHLTASLQTLASEFPDLKFALEYKPKEPRTHSYLARMADTLLVCLETRAPNVGVTIDTGHAWVAGEVIAEQVVLAHRTGNKLFHMHFNDNFSQWDDDMIVGSIHSIEYIEMLYWLDRVGYTGWLSMDQYPYREDAAGAIGESIEWLVKFARAADTYRTEITGLLKHRDPVKTSAFLRKILLN